jgi:hypothetical protein
MSAYSVEASLSDSPTPLWKFVTEIPDVFGAEVLTKLDEIDLKIFYDLCRASREVVKQSKIELNNKKRYVYDIKSIPELELAWDNYRWGERDRFGLEITQERFCHRVAKTNNLEFLKWAREVKRCAWDKWTIISAASQGDLDMVKYCVDNDCPMNARACAYAAEEGHLDVLEYLYEHGCPWNRWTITQAAFQGNLSMVKYCVENNCPMDAYACSCAAEGGHLAILKYLREHGCPWESKTCRCAHMRNHIDCLNYAIEQRCPGYERFI